MGIIDPLDPCLIFYPGELPEDIQDRIDGGIVVVPNGTRTNADPIDPIDWDRPPQPPRPPGDVEEPRRRPPVGFVWVCRDGRVFLIRANELAPGEVGYPSQALARNACDEPSGPGGPDDGEPDGPGGPDDGEPDGPGGGGPGDGDSGGGDGDPEPQIRWKCQEITHQLGTNGSVVVIRRVCVSTTDVNAAFASLPECLAECQTVIVEDGSTTTPTQTDPETPGGDEPTQDEEDDGDGGGVIIEPGDTQGPIEPEEPENEYDEGDITYSADAVATLPNYFPTLENTPIRETLEQGNQTTIFASLQAPTVNYLIRQQPQGSIKKINEKLKTLSPTKIKESVAQNFANIIYNLVEPDGRRIPESRMSVSLQLYLLQGNARKINVPYLLKLQTRALLGNTARTARFINYIDSRYGTNQPDLLVNRILNMGRLTSTRTTQRTIIPSAQRGVARAYQNAKSLDWRSYSDAKSEHLKLWNILPEDIYAKTTVADQNGNISKINIKNDLSLLGIASGNQPIRVPVNSYTFNVTVQTASGPVIVPVDSELDRAVTLNNKTEQACLFDVGVEKEYKLTVTSPSTLNLELNHNVNENRSSHYVLILDASTMQDAEEKKSAFARTTVANYKLVRVASRIQEALEFRAYPWLMMPVYHNDPVLAHFTTSSTYQVEFNDFSLEEFGDDISGPIFIRKIPKAILIIPTDRYDYLIYNGQSTLEDWNVRSLSFVPSPDPNYYDVGLRSSWLKLELAYPNTDIDNGISPHGVRATYETSVPIITNTFVNGVEPSRSESAFRVATKIASGLNDAYTTNNGVLWSDVYSRMTEQQYKTHKVGISNKMLEKLRKGDLTGVRLVHDKGQSLQTRLTSLKPNKLDPFTLYLTRE